MPQTKAERLTEIRTELRLMEDRRVTENRDFTEPESQRALQLIEERERLNMTQTTTRRYSDEEIRQEMNRLTGGSGFDPKWDKRYSLLRAIECRLTKGYVDGYEGEVSQELVRRTGKAPNGFLMPMGLPMGGGERRDLDTTAGAGAVHTNFLGSRFIDALRNKTLLLSMGATLLTDLVGDVQIPKLTTTSQAYWVNEAAPVTESAPAVGSVTMLPKTVGTFVDITRKLVKQSSFDCEMMVRNDLVRVLGIELDRVGINGSGSGAEPQGILQNSSIQTVAIETNGGDPTWAKIVELESVVATANADSGSLGHLTSAYGRGKLKTVAKGDAGYPIHLWSENNTVNGYRAGATAQVPSNLTKGTGENLTAVIFGDWSSMIFGTWGAVDINIDPYSLGTSGGVRIVAMLDCQVKFRHVESFAKIVDMNRA